MEYDKDCKTSEELNDDQIIAAVLENNGVETVNDDSRTPSSDFTHRRWERFWYYPSLHQAELNFNTNLQCLKNWIYIYKKYHYECFLKL